jgi:hypothetical protein
LPWLNGFVIQNNNFEPFISGGWGLISHDQSGSGYFLYEGTNNGSAPSYQGKVWETFAPVPVLPDTTYAFSFYLTNSNGQNPAIIQPFINGAPIGPGVSALGFFTDGIPGHEWQQFTFTWNSGSSTTAILSLVNQQTVGGGAGDDFGIDTIAFSPFSASVPEPSTLTLLALGSCGVLGYGWRRRRAT